jgi:hypothetical protein
MEGEDDNAFLKKRIVQVNHENRGITNIILIKIQVSKSNG